MFRFLDNMPDWTQSPLFFVFSILCVLLFIALLFTLIVGFVLFALRNKPSKRIKGKGP